MIVNNISEILKDCVWIKIKEFLILWTVWMFSQHAPCSIFFLPFKNKTATKQTISKELRCDHWHLFLQDSQDFVGGIKNGSVFFLLS